MTKICYLSLFGTCDQVCTSPHPVNVQDALLEFQTKRTRNMCRFYPKCARANCSFLHVATVVGGSSSVLRVLPPRRRVTETQDPPLLSMAVVALKAYRDAEQVSDPNVEVYRKNCNVFAAKLRRENEVCETLYCQ